MPALEVLKNIDVDGEDLYFKVEAYVMDKGLQSYIVTNEEKKSLVESLKTAKLTKSKKGVTARDYYIILKSNKYVTFYVIQSDQGNYIYQPETDTYYKFDKNNDFVDQIFQLDIGQVED